MRIALRLVSVAAVAGLLGGCETIEQNVGDLFGDYSSSVADAEASERAYTLADYVPVHADASAASPVIGRLRLHERVTRGATRDGFAQITADGSKLTGWVDGSELIASLPASPAPHRLRHSPPPPRPEAPATTAPDSEAETPRETVPAETPTAAPAAPAAPPASELEAPMEAPVKVASDAPPADAATDLPAVDPPTAKTKPAGEMLNPF